MLVQVTRAAMHAGIDAVKPGGRVHDIGRAIEAEVDRHGGRFGIVREFIGHGIGDQFHTSLQIPHYFDPRAGTVFEQGMKDMAAIIVDATRLLAEAIPLLRDVPANSKRLHELTERLVRVS